MARSDRRREPAFDDDFRGDPRSGIVTHHAYVDISDGPYPFHEPSGELIA